MSFSRIRSGWERQREENSNILQYRVHWCLIIDGVGFAWYTKKHTESYICRTHAHLVNFSSSTNIVWKRKFEWMFIVHGVEQISLFCLLWSPYMARTCNYWFETGTLELEISNLVNFMRSSCEHSAYIGERHHQNTSFNNTVCSLQCLVWSDSKCESGKVRK